MSQLTPNIKLEIKNYFFEKVLLALQKLSHAIDPNNVRAIIGEVTNRWVRVASTPTAVPAITAAPIPITQTNIPSAIDRIRFISITRRFLVELTGIEPVASWLQTRRSPS